MANKQDKIKEEVFSLMNYGIQVDLDVVMAHLIAGKPVLANDRAKELQKKTEKLNRLLDELKEGNKIDLSSRG